MNGKKEEEATDGRRFFEHGMANGSPAEGKWGFEFAKLFSRLFAKKEMHIQMVGLALQELKEVASQLLVTHCSSQRITGWWTRFSSDPSRAIAIIVAHPTDLIKVHLQAVAAELTAFLAYKQKNALPLSGLVDFINGGPPCENGFRWKMRRISAGEEETTTRNGGRPTLKRIDD